MAADEFFRREAEEVRGRGCEGEGGERGESVRV